MSTREPAAVEIRPLVRPESLVDAGADAALFRAAADVAIRVRREQWGDDDHTDSLLEQFVLATDTSAEHRRAWIALDDGAEVTGLLTAGLPQRENPTVAWVDVLVHPGHRRRGIGSALLAVAEPALRTAGRTVLEGWSEIPDTAIGADPGTDADLETARSGAGAVPRSAPGVAFARRHGFALEQVERLSRLDLPVPAATLDAVSPQASRAAGYELVGWADTAPAALAEDHGRLRSAMSTDIPSADLELGEEDWDPGRVAEEEAELAVRGGHRLVTAVRHAGSGRLVGHTVLERFDARPDVAYQQDTLVLAGHRGHRLGMLLKVDALRRLAEVWPDVRRIYTWNAEENTPVLDLNVPLGFRRVGLVGAWQKRLS